MDGLLQRLQHGDVGLKAGLRRGRQQHRLEAQRLQRVAVGRIAGIGQRYPVAHVEGGEEGENDPGRAPGGDDDAVRRQGEAVALAIEGGDALAQRQHTVGFGVADLLGGQRGLRRVQDRLRRARAGLARLHVEDPRALCRTRRRGLENLHREEGRDRRAPGCHHRRALERRGEHERGGGRH